MGTGVGKGVYGLRVRHVDQDYFQLRDGRTFKHLFTWSYVPSLSDFEVLLLHCYEMMTDKLLEVCPLKEKLFRKKNKKRVSRGKS